MNKRLKARWIKALRSGKYAQTDGQLCNTRQDGSQSFCCLGVLREIEPTAVRQRHGMELLEEETCGMHQSVQEKLARYNDDGKSFKWIAAYIERRKTL